MIFVFTKDLINAMIYLYETEYVVALVIFFASNLNSFRNSNSNIKMLALKFWFYKFIIISCVSNNKKLHNLFRNKNMYISAFVFLNLFEFITKFRKTTTAFKYKLKAN